MGKKRRRGPKWKPVRVEELDSDTVSLGDLFKELLSQHPGLVVEETDNQNIESRRGVNIADEEQAGNMVTLWHGTTEDRATSIISHGFIRAHGGIWMTPQRNYATAHAINRAQNRKRVAVLLRCRVDLDRFSDYAKSGPHYAFRCPLISSHVVSGIYRLEADQSSVQIRRLLDITITRTSGKQDVLNWINGCLKLIHEEPASENHPAVEALFRWVEAQYASGRDDPITEEEMLIQMSIVSIKQAARHLNVGTQIVERWLDNRRLKARSLRECPIVPLNPQNLRVDGKQKAIKLWYGTTERRAKAIVEEGFKRAEVRFTRKLSAARDTAINRARQRSDVPVVLCCEIDLEEYPSFGKFGPDTYVFYTPTGKGAVDGATIGKEVVRDISIVEDKPAKRAKEKVGGQKDIDVVVTGTSGKLGVLWWINRYLELEGKTQVDGNHPAVEAISRWVDAQYAEGRDNPISQKEMLSQVEQHL